MFDQEINLTGITRADIGITGTAQRSAAFNSMQRAMLISTADVYLKGHPNAADADVTVANGFLLTAGNMIAVVMPAGSTIGVIGTSGTLTILRGA